MGNSNTRRRFRLSTELRREFISGREAVTRRLSHATHAGVSEFLRHYWSEQWDVTKSHLVRERNEIPSCVVRRVSFDERK